MQRVAITGLGVVTPLGCDVPVFWQRLIAGERGIERITKFDPTGLRNETAGEVRDWAYDGEGFGLDGIPDEATQFLLHAAREAVADAGLAMGQSPDVRAGAILSTNFGGCTSWEEYGRAFLAGEPGTEFAEFTFDAALSHLCDAFGLAGPSSVLSIACASGAAAIGYALDLVRDGCADVMLAGGHDFLAPSPLAGLSNLHTITPEDIRPFSADRSGTLFGEGAGVLVLESLEHARARGARVYCEVLGSWQNNNAYHLTAPDKGGVGMAAVLREALADAELDGGEVDYINAHGTGTEYHDPAETDAIKAVLGSRAYEIPVSSIKGSIAHLMGAAGAVEAVATVKAIETGVVPPTVNYRERDAECDLDYVTEGAREVEVRYAATISAGVGGSNGCVVFGGLSRGAARAAKAVDRSRVLVTGMGPIAAIGIGREDFADGLESGREGRRPPERLADAAGASGLVAECLDFVVEDHLQSEKTYLDRCSEFTLAACALALEDAGVELTALDSRRVGLCLGTAYGCLDSMVNVTARVQSKGVRFASPVVFIHSMANTPTSLAAIEYEIRGPASTFCVGDASAGSALEYAWRMIRDGRADVVLAGGAEALSAPLLGYLGVGRGDIVAGEGACLLVLESEGHAAARGVRAIGEVMSCALGRYDVEALGASAYQAPEEYGHAFGASLALDVAAALLSEEPGDVAVCKRDHSGNAAAIVVRSLQ